MRWSDAKQRVDDVLDPETFSRASNAGKDFLRRNSRIFETFDFVEANVTSATPRLFGKMLAEAGGQSSVPASSRQRKTGASDPIIVAKL